ncbi:MAG: transporter [Sphingomonadaceae bacterium]
MTRTCFGAVLALPLLLCAIPAAASEDEKTADPASDIVAQGRRADEHGPAGTMADHVHKRGDLMLGLSWMHESYGGANRAGTEAIGDEAIAAAGYAVKADAMTMDMAMLHIMWAPNDRVTLMAVPSWMRMGMTMKGLPAAPMGQAGAAKGTAAMPMMPGQTMSHAVEGIGDTQVGALLVLSRRPRLSVHAGLMVSIPTGKADRRNAAGSYVHYMMQGGSGTWDLNPTLTLRGTRAGFGWGAQLGYLFRAEKANVSGFRFGDRFTATAWLSKPLGANLSLAGRVQWTGEEEVRGHYNAAHNHASPPDRQANYGGQRLDLGLGANLVVGHGYRIGVEMVVQAWQRLNGIQLPRQFGANLTMSRLF